MISVCGCMSEHERDRLMFSVTFFYLSWILYSEKIRTSLCFFPSHIITWDWYTTVIKREKVTQGRETIGNLSRLNHVSNSTSLNLCFFSPSAGFTAAGLSDQERVWKSRHQCQRTHLRPAISRKLPLHWWVSKWKSLKIKQTEILLINWDRKWDNSLGSIDTQCL